MGKKAEKKPSGGPKLLLLCGLPGCGKSTFSQGLEQRGGWIRVSPDDIGIMEECKKLIEKGLKHGSNVVLDRCNASDKERKMFVREAAEFTDDVSVVYFNVPVDVCLARAKARPSHPTLTPEKADEVVTMFSKTMRVPERLTEGPYKAIHVVSSDDEVKALLIRFLAGEL